MKAIETTGQFDEQGKLHIKFPHALRNQKVKLIILIPEEEDIESMFGGSHLGCKCQIPEPHFAISSLHSAAMKLKNAFVRTQNLTFSLPKHHLQTCSDEGEWLTAIQNNESFDFLNDPEEDIYTIEDGRQIEENVV